MNPVKKLACLFCLLLLPAAASAAGLSQGVKDTIYIGEVQVQPSVKDLARKQGTSAELQRLADSLETQLISSLNATRVFQLMERKRKTELELEQEFAADAGAPDDKSAAQSGRMAGARFAFLPRIDGFEDNAEPVYHAAIDRSAMSRKLFLSALVQIVDTTTGRLLPDAPSIQLAKSEEVTKPGAGQVTGSDQLIVALAREMAQKLSQEIVALLRPAKVLSVSGKQIMFNRGTESGFEKGDLVEIYATQPVKDDDSGEIFMSETLVGQAIIIRLDKKQSFANISGDDLGIIKGAVVRKLKSAAVRRSDAETQPPDPTIPVLGPNDPAETTPGSSEKPLKWK